MATANPNGAPWTFSFSDTESADRLVIAAAHNGSLPDQWWTYDFDTSHRVIRSVVSRGAADVQVNTYSYQDGEIDEVATGQFNFTVRATGSCPPPMVATTPTPPLPLQWSAN